MEQQIDPMEIEEVNDKVRSGEYFREARTMYGFFVNDPMSERYLYIFITLLAIIVLYIGATAAMQLFPLGRREPFVFDSYNIDDELPVVKPLKAFKDQDPNIAILNFLLDNYVKLRENYEIVQIERNANGVRSQSLPKVYQEYQYNMDPSNAPSPIARYQRDAKRQVVVRDINIFEKKSADVIFDAYVDAGKQRDTTRWVATIAFDYEDVKVDDDAVITPFQFVVTNYSVRQIQ